MEKATMQIWAIPDAEVKRGFRLMLCDPERSFYMYASDEIKIGETEVVFSPPEDMTEEAMVRKAIETLEKKQEVVMQDAARKKQALQKKIDGLLLLQAPQGSI